MGSEPKIGDRVRLLPPVNDEHDDSWTGECGVIVATDYYDAPLYGVLFDKVILRNRMDEGGMWLMYAEEFEPEAKQVTP